MAVKELWQLFCVFEFPERQKFKNAGIATLLTSHTLCDLSEKVLII